MTHKIQTRLLYKFLLLLVPGFIILAAILLESLLEYQAERERDRLQAHVAALSVKMGLLVGHAYSEDDAPQMRRILSLLSGDQAVECAEFIDLEGHNIMSWPGPECRQLISPEAHLLTSEARNDRQVKVGTFKLYHNESTIRSLIIELRWAMAVGVTTSFIVAVSLAIVAFLRLVSARINQLLQMIARIAEGGRREAVAVSGNDEIADLMHAFNELTNRENSNEAALRRSSEELAFEVQERKQAEDQLRKAQDHLIQTSKIRAVATLAGGMAHEINTPLQAVTGIVEYLRQISAEIPPDGQISAALAEELRLELPDIAQQSQQAIERIAVILSATKRLSASLTGQTASPSRPIDLPQLMQEIVLTTKPVWDGVSRLEVICDDGIRPIAGNDLDLGEAVGNMIRNAVQAINDADRAGHGVISITLTNHRKGAQVTISDNGCGMDQATQEQCRDPFFTTRAVGGGAGLGFTIACDYLENRLGAPVTLETTPNQGTKISFVLPYAPLEKTKASPAAKPGTAEAG